VTGNATTLVLQFSCDCLGTQGIVNYSGALPLPGLLKQIKQLVSFALGVSSTFFRLFHLLLADV
jgi:hypothetical protein